MLHDGRFAGARVAANVASHAAEWPDAVAIGVDIPIGLPETPGRETDRAARRMRRLCKAL
jgi:predicted RNase H-like nuclease